MFKKITMSVLLALSSFQTVWAAEQMFVPYFTDVAGWHTRFGVTNPTDKKVAITIRAYSVDGDQLTFNHFVLEPNAMIVALFSATGTNTSRWYVPTNENTCVFYDDSKPNQVLEFEGREGYLTISSEDFTTFGPGGFCGNDYTTVDTKELRTEFSIWDADKKQVFDSRTNPTTVNPVNTTWTKNVDDKGNQRGTSWVVTLPDYVKGQCQEFEYLVSDRDGNSFQTYDVTEPGPVGYKNVELCHKANVIYFGTPVLPSLTGITAKSQMPFVDKIDTGWTQLMGPAFNYSIRSNW